jgi:excisionase family DNA binding protein
MQLVTVKEAAPKLGLDKQGLYRILREGQFPFPQAVVRFGKQVRINLAAIEEATKRQPATEQKVAA